MTWQQVLSSPAFRALVSIQIESKALHPPSGGSETSLRVSARGVHWQFGQQPAARIPSPKPRSSTSTLPREGKGRCGRVSWAGVDGAGALGSAFANKYGYNKPRRPCFCGLAVRLVHSRRFRFDGVTTSERLLPAPRLIDGHQRRTSLDRI